MNTENEYSALNLAYIGDAVFELYTRANVLARGNLPVNKQHAAAKALVNAVAQAKMYYKIIDILSDEELAVLKRGRNAKSHTSAKHASITDYRHATGLEALFGYLFIKGKSDRLQEIFEACIKEGETNENEF